MIGMMSQVMSFTIDKVICIMKKTLLAFVVLAIGFVSCTKDSFTQVSEPVTSFTAVIEQTKTTIDNVGIVTWKEGDVIFVTGKNQSGATVTRKYTADADGDPVSFSYADEAGVNCMKAHIALHTETLAARHIPKLEPTALWREKQRKERFLCSKTLVLWRRSRFRPQRERA